MIERTIEKITDTEKKIEKDITRLEKRWDLKLKSEKITNLQKLKEHKRTVKKKIEIQRSERLRFIEKDIQDMDKETDKNIRHLKETYNGKKKEMLTLIKKDLDTEDKK